MASGYRSLLAVPRLGRQAVAGFAAQLTQSAGPLGIILVVRQQTGSLALAGAVTAGFALGAGVARPLQGRLIDRRGPAGVLSGLGLAHMAALLALVAVARLDAAAAPLVVLGVLAGLAEPPVSVTMRLSWGRLSGADRTAAYTLVTTTQELAVLVGPLIVGALVSVASASVALVGVALLAGAGTILFALSVRAPELVEARPAAPRASVLRSAGTPSVLATALAIGIAFGALEVAAPALALAHGTPATSGLLIAALSVGGIVGGVAYGARRWRAGPATRLVVVLGLCTAALAPLPAVHGLALAGGVLLVAGLALNPAVTTVSLLVDRRIAARAAEALGWLSTALASGYAAGSALAGVLAQQAGGASSAFLVAAVASAVAAIVATIARPALASSEPTGAAAERDDPGGAVRGGMA